MKIIATSMTLSSLNPPLLGTKECDSPASILLSLRIKICRLLIVCFVAVFILNLKYLQYLATRFEIRRTDALSE